jgi:hypothetical protein
VFEKLKPTYLAKGAGLAEVPPVQTAAPKRGGFWNCLFGPPEYVKTQPEPPPAESPARSVTVDIRCPEITADGPELQLAPAVVVALPVGSTNVKVWSSGTRAAKPNAPVTAFLVGLAPEGVVPTPGQLAFRPLWARICSDGASAGSLEATLLVTFEA